jgi:hypothetical protein
MKYTQTCLSQKEEMDGKMHLSQKEEMHSNFAL